MNTIRPITSILSSSSMFFSVAKQQQPLLQRSVIGAAIGSGSGLLNSQNRFLHSNRPVYFKVSKPAKLFGDNVPNPETVPIHESKKTKGSYHWVYERGLSISLVPIVGTAIVYGAHPINDLLLGIVVPLHVHMGMESILTDYFHSRRWPKIGPTLNWALRLVTLLALYGCWKINTEDVGVSDYVRRLWNANKLKNNGDENN